MTPLQPNTYEIPQEVIAAEQSQILTNELRVENFRESKSKYCAAYNTMVYLEEIAQKVFIEAFNQTNVNIFYEGNGPIFYILNDVSIIV